MRKLLNRAAAIAAALILFSTAPVIAADASLPSSGRPNEMWDGTGFQLERTPIIYKTVSAVVVTSAATVWTPASGKKFLVMGFCLAQGVVTGALTLKDGGTAFFIIPQSTVGVGQCFDLPGNGYLSTTANNALTVIGASTETVTGTFFGTEE